MQRKMRKFDRAKQRRQNEPEKIVWPCNENSNLSHSSRKNQSERKKTQRKENGLQMVFRLGQRALSQLRRIGKICGTLNSVPFYRFNSCMCGSCFFFHSRPFSMLNIYIIFVCICRGVHSAWMKEICVVAFEQRLHFIKRENTLVFFLLFSLLSRSTFLHFYSFFYHIVNAIQLVRLQYE